MGRKRKYPKHKQKHPKWYQKENDWGDFVFDFTLGLGAGTWREIFAILVLIFAVVILLGYFEMAGNFGSSVAHIIRKIFGSFPGYVFPIIIFWFGVLLLFPNRDKQRVSRFIGFILLIIFLSATLHLFIPLLDTREAAFAGSGGGILGYMISDPLRKGVGLFASFLITFALDVIALMMIFNISFTQLFGWESAKGNKEDDDDVKVNRGNRVSVFKTLRNKLASMKKPREGVAKAPVIEAEPRIVARDMSWQYPPVEILKDSDDVANPGNIQKNVEVIQKTLKNFGIDIVMGEVNIGPTVTQYTFKPVEGVKLNQITARANDLALALASKSLRMEAPIPGKSSVGIENPNKVPAKVTLKEVMVSQEFKAVKSKLTIALGRDVAGTSYAVDLEKMPHVLIAGATGSGKSVCINTIITTFLFHNSPNDLKLLMVDPKRVELTNYNDIPHLLTPVVTEVGKTVSALKWAIWEMERRYKMFSELGKRNITAYNESPGPEGKLPYIVIVIDELADLMATSANEVEGSIVRLAQMARATGMHLIVATQRPSVDVLTGLIKANITCRIAFATASQVDSRTILDMSGAEKLLGNGDMLFVGNGLTKPRRIQGCFVSDKEINDLVDFLKELSPPDYDDTILQFKSSKGSSGAFGDGSAEDDLYDDALKVVMQAGKASASLLQRRLRIGYARAARLLDILEENGAIGPADGAKPRDVLVSDTGSEGFIPSGDDVPDDKDEYNNFYH
ncbi:MAG: DNA translocase FtsK [Patescibacteria group bacterium]